jgi:hypothetical protein
MYPLLLVSVWLSQTAQTTCDLTFRASPLRGIAPSRFRAGSSAFLVLSQISDSIGFSGGGPPSYAILLKLPGVILKVCLHGKDPMA